MGGDRRKTLAAASAGRHNCGRHCQRQARRIIRRSPDRERCEGAPLVYEGDCGGWLCVKVALPCQCGMIVGIDRGSGLKARLCIFPYRDCGSASALCTVRRQHHHHHTLAPPGTQRSRIPTHTHARPGFQSCLKHEDAQVGAVVRHEHAARLVRHVVAEALRACGGRGRSWEGRAGYAWADRQLPRHDAVGASLATRPVSRTSPMMQCHTAPNLRSRDSLASCAAFCACRG